MKSCFTHIGSDESLKGDSFGGLVVAGAIFKGSELESLKDLGVADCKTLTVKKNNQLARVLLNKFENRFSVKIFSPREYNKNYLEGFNVTKMLNEGHSLVHDELVNRNPVLVSDCSVTWFVDEYPGCDCGDVVETKADSKYLVVAAASVIARYYALRVFDGLSETAGFTIPRGSSSPFIERSINVLLERDFDLSDYCKLSFSNVKRFINNYECR